MDRDKVIKGLERCDGETLCIGENCPYFDDEMCVETLHSDALDLLKTQGPVEPVPAIDNDGDWLCGNCYQSVVGEEKLDAGGFVPVRFNFCPNCGRAVKWE